MADVYDNETVSEYLFYLSASKESVGRRKNIVSMETRWPLFQYMYLSQDLTNTMVCLMNETVSTDDEMSVTRNSNNIAA